MFGIFKKVRRTEPPAALAPDRNLHNLDIWQSSSLGLSQVDDELLRARLAETVAWCDALTSLADFRSEMLRPSLFHDGMDDLVRDLGQSRQHQLRYRNLQVQHESPVIASGKFMLYFPDENLADGYAEAVSGGFFDGDNVPACDTWVSFFSEEGYPRRPARRYLLCYVPAPLIGAADAGIEGNPESCIVWLEDSSASIRRRLETLTNPAPVQTNVP